MSAWIERCTRGRRARRRGMALVVSASLALAPLAAPAPVVAGGSESVVSPGYPGSRLALSVPRTARAGSVVQVTATGTNALFNPGQPLASPAYKLDVFVQDRRALPKCPLTYGEQLDNIINLGSRSILQIVRARDLGIQDDFRVQQRYRAGSVRRVRYCAYTRLVTDDVAVATLARDLRRARSR